ncbi:hypothetical protein [Loigolactobacillus bifermentans]|jgi:DNA-binding protein YbaB|uniref:Uncharacterized protein n=1 Tax=Loigolactobacillus bifermentans DSM 20003 TaxID=1423726 RepID=A0A0R1H210_9LACO|nr:hypothetical protein [Loigolactobacillus bifermentans]KRK40485.1 hypothetical protein FC07_GL000496 [Loigolactobacillus bifermentans DSM 20003]
MMTWEHLLQNQLDDGKSEGNGVTIEVPNTKEKLTLKIDADVVEKLANDNTKLELLIKRLLSRHQKTTTRETIVINKRNLRIFI